jgi:hypothetical protein
MPDPQIIHTACAQMLAIAQDLTEESAILIRLKQTTPDLSPTIHRLRDLSDQVAFLSKLLTADSAT